MDCWELPNTLNMLSYLGVCPSTEHSLLLQNSLALMEEKNNSWKYYYLGIIFGDQFEYYIAYAIKKGHRTEQLYYYSGNCVDWYLLPKVTKCGRSLRHLAVNKFIGRPFAVTNIEFSLLFSLNDQKTYHYGPMRRLWKEEDRLAATVESIMTDTAIVPRGAWLQCDNGDIVENPSFYGLCAADACQLRFFLHARPMQQNQAINVRTQPDYNYSLDFSDNIGMDVPQNECWDLHVSGKKVFLRNLLWPGMFFFHILNSKVYGFQYTGYGKKNKDEPFMNV